jgi:hypothetical protein
VRAHGTADQLERDIGGIQVSQPSDFAYAIHLRGPLVDVIELDEPDIEIDKGVASRPSRIQFGEQFARQLGRCTGAYLDSAGRQRRRCASLAPPPRAGWSVRRCCDRPSPDSLLKRGAPLPARRRSPDSHLPSRWPDSCNWRRPPVASRPFRLGLHRSAPFGRSACRPPAAPHPPDGQNRPVRPNARQKPGWPARRTSVLQSWRASVPTIHGA